MKSTAVFGVAAAVLTFAAAAIYLRVSADPPYAPSSRGSASELAREHAVRLAFIAADEIIVADSDSLPILVVTQSDVWLGTQHLLTVPADAPDGGLADRDKRNGRRDLYVTTLGAALENARSADGGSPLDELRIVVDERVPYRVLVEVTFTAGQAGFSKFDEARLNGSDIVLVRRTPRTAH